MKALPLAIASVATTSAAILVLLVYAPAFQAPFLVPKFAVLEVCATLGAIALALSRLATGAPTWSRPLARGTTLLLLTTLASWALAKSAPYADDALARWGALLGIACGASVAAGSTAARDRIVEAIGFAAIVVAVLGLCQHTGLLPQALRLPVFSTPGSTFGNRNLAAEVMAMALPFGVTFALRGVDTSSRRFFLFATVIELAFLAVTRARGAWVGAIFGLVVAVWPSRRQLFATRRRVGVALTLVAVAVTAASVPGHFTTHDMGDTKRYAPVAVVLEQSVDLESTALRTRLGFWRRTLDMVRTSPLFGVGPGNWPVLFPKYAEPGALSDGVLTVALAPRQAHNDLVERAAETGLVGVVGLLAFAVGVVRAARGQRDVESAPVASSALGSLAALAGLSLASFPLEMPGTLALAGLSIGLIAPATEKAGSPRPRPLRRGWLAFAVGLGALALGCALVRVERRALASYLLGLGERALHPGPGAPTSEEGVVALTRAVATNPSSFRARLKLSQLLLVVGRAEESARAAEGALAIEPYTASAWVALAHAEAAAGRPGEARSAATFALDLLHDDPPALEVRARVDEEEGTHPDQARSDRAALRALADSRDRDTRRSARRLLHQSDE